ncbi:hypothetical protein [Coraliomargarita parva]|uniref:hypothetical protein n=1 Tax=Coraliomargarita parva TaxID=3014050 RepID=UPI0022B2B2FF|nr:hypothetical protein [Coraliomargarita parva]
MKKTISVLTAFSSSIGMFAVATSSSASVLGITDIGLSPDPGGSTIVDTTLITSFTTSNGTYSGLQGAVTSTANGTAYYGPDSVTVGDSSILGLDVSTGFANFVTNDVGFGQVVDTAEAFFMTEFLYGGSQDDVTIVPLDLAGNPIGDFSLSIAYTAWGAGLDAQHIRGSGINFTGNVRGIAFQLEDFEGTGTLSGVAGLRINSANADPSVIGYATAIPEAGSCALIGGWLAFAAMTLRRRLK